MIFAIISRFKKIPQNRLRIIVINYDDFNENNSIKRTLHLNTMIFLFLSFKNSKNKTHSFSLLIFIELSLKKYSRIPK